MVRRLEDDVTLLLHHTHPNSSNDTEANIRGYDAANHQTDYFKLAEFLPEGSSFIATKSDHWKKTPSFWSSMEVELTQKDSEHSFERHDTHITFEYDGVRAAVIDGIEASLLDDAYHFTLIGGDIEEEKNLNNITTQELYREAKDFAFASPAHPHLPGFDTPDELIQDFLRTADDEDDITAAMNFATGYTTSFNKMARGTHFFRRNRTPVQEYADNYGIELIPELDMHASFPNRLEGAGIVDISAMDKLENGEIPVEKLLGCDVLSYGKTGSEGMSNPKFLRTYPDMADLGFNSYERILSKTPGVPYTEEEFQGLFRESLESLNRFPEDQEEWKRKLKVNRYNPLSKYINERS